VLDYKASEKLPWPYYTPTSQYADFTALNQLPKVKLDFDYQYTKDDKFGTITLKVRNQTGSIAFFICFDPRDPSTGKPVLPVYWDDNYVTLFPGEVRTYSAKYFLRDAGDGKPFINVNGWNVEMVSLK
jgi:exo-1,4-beta-D-glucosaminidase